MEEFGFMAVCNGDFDEICVLHGGFSGMRKKRDKGDGPWRCWLRGGVCRRRIWRDFYPYRRLSLISTAWIPKSGIANHSPSSFSSGPHTPYPVPPATYPQNQRAKISSTVSWGGIPSSAEHHIEERDS